MKNTHGFILPLVLLTLSGLLLYSTLVWYQTFYAYYSVWQQHHTYQYEYALNGLLNQAVDECITRVRTSGAFTQSYTYVASEWNMQNKIARVVIEPQEKRSYKIIAFIGSLSKIRLLEVKL